MQDHTSSHLTCAFTRRPVHDCSRWVQGLSPAIPRTMMFISSPSCRKVNEVRKGLAGLIICLVSCGKRKRRDMTHARSYDQCLQQLSADALSVRSPPHFGDARLDHPPPRTRLLRCWVRIAASEYRYFLDGHMT